MAIESLKVSSPYCLLLSVSCLIFPEVACLAPNPIPNGCQASWQCSPFGLLAGAGWNTVPAGHHCTHCWNRCSCWEPAGTGMHDQPSQPANLAHPNGLYYSPVFNNLTFASYQRIMGKKTQYQIVIVVC